MKSLRTVRYSLIAAAVAGAAVVSTPAFAEVSATASIASTYLWRGQSLGGSTPVVAGSLDYKHDSGLFAGIWGSSGDTVNGLETDLYFGYGLKAGEVDLTAAYYYYAYPKNFAATPVDNDFKEIYLSAGVSGFKAEAFVGVGSAPWGDNGDNYYALSYTMDKITGKLGMYDGDASNTVAPGGGSYTHLDVAYAYNANLAFTLSKVVDTDAGPKGDPLFVVSYAIPLK